MQNAAVEVMVGSVPLSGIKSLATGGNTNSSFAVAADGTVWAWGANGNGEMGNGTIGAEQYTPAQVLVGGPGSAALTGIKEIVGFGYSVIARRFDGTVWGWGNTANCQLAEPGPAGEEPFFSTPIQISGISGVTAIGGAPGTRSRGRRTGASGPGA